VTELEAGFYRYVPDGHLLHQIDSISYQTKIYSSGLRQKSLKNPSVTILLVADYGVITPKYGDRGIRYTFIEAGHIAQNICLQCESLGLGTVTIGAFDEEKLQEEVPVENHIIYILPVGRPSNH
jgi:SagB-type dehydrogenase family enzyme